MCFRDRSHHVEDLPGLNPTAAFIGGEARVLFSVLIQTRTNIIRLQTPTRIASAFGPRRRTGAARCGMWDRSILS